MCEVSIVLAQVFFWVVLNARIARCTFLRTSQRGHTSNPEVFSTDAADAEHNQLPWYPFYPPSLLIITTESAAEDNGQGGPAVCVGWRLPGDRSLYRKCL